MQKQGRMQPSLSGNKQRGNPNCHLKSTGPGAGGQPRNHTNQKPNRPERRWKGRVKTRPPEPKQLRTLMAHL